MKHTNAIRQSFAFTIIFCFLFSVHAISQTVWDTLPWKQHADYQLQNLNKTLIPTGILYDRVFPFANADEYTGLPAYTNIDTTSDGHFAQAYYEMYNSAYNNTSWLAPDSLDNKMKSDGFGTVPIGIMLYKFNSVDTNALQDHLLDTLANGQFTDVPAPPRSPYFTNTSFLASPLLAEGEVLEAGQQTFYIDPSFFLTNTAGTMQQIRVDFGDGQGEWIVNNPYNTTSLRGGVGRFITKNIFGRILIGRIIVVFIDILGQSVTYGNPFKITIKNDKVYAPLTDCKGGGQKWVIESPASRLAPINAQYGNPVLNYTKKLNVPCPAGSPTGSQCIETRQVKDTAYFYFAGNGTSCDKTVLRKPVIFIDGFDPTNSRGVQQIYENYINKRVTRNGDPNTLFGDYILNEGYDFVILDFKHGNDLLERNAMTLVSLIEQLNQTYSNTMQQGITLIGPSMGSLIAQYALAYMEHNNIPHNIKTYISFDGCHQGANVPIGLQNYIEYFTKRGIFKNNKSIREGLYNGLAARQMLAHHTSANSESPAPDALRNIFLQNLATVGNYPQLCRKVALINGTNAGTINADHPNPSELMLRISTKRKGWKSLWGACNDKICMKLDWNCFTTPNTSRAKVTDNWTVEPLFNLLFWVPLGKVNTYAQPAWGNSAQDNAPGGTFGRIFGTLPGDVIESKFSFLLKEAMYLLTGSKRTEFYQKINQFTMMPSYSAADLRFPQKNLYMKWDDQYLCGKTPFDYIYAPPANEQHVTVSAAGSQYFENEIKCAVGTLPVFIRNEIVGVPNFCNSSTYSLESCKPFAPSAISWTATPSGIVSIVNNGNSAILTRLSGGVVTLNATSASSCGNNFNFSKQITVGPPLPITNIQTAYTMFKCNVVKYIFTVIGAQGATNYKWYYRNITQGTPFELFKNSSANFANSPVNDGSCDQIEIRIDATNECSVTPEQYLFMSDLCPPFTDGSCSSGRMLSASPNPSISNIQLQLIDEPNVKPANSQPKKIMQIRIVDKMGQIKRTINGNQLAKMIINLSGLPTDIYTILVFDGREWMSKQVNKN